MRDRSSPARDSARRTALSIDVMLLTPNARRLNLLLVRSSQRRARERWGLPWAARRAEESLEETAIRVARTTLGATPSWLEQIAAFGDARRHPAGAEVSIGFLGLVPVGAPPPPGGETGWFPIEELPPVPPRQHAIIEEGIATLRDRLDNSPIAFRLLPTAFTLSQLQEVYELLLGRRLHKASFRRALHAAWLIEPTDEWRSEGRGRPAQLFRFAPRKRRGGRRGVRFDAIS